MNSQQWNKCQKVSFDKRVFTYAAKKKQLVLGLERAFNKQTVCWKAKSLPEYRPVVSGSESTSVNSPYEMIVQAS